MELNQTTLRGILAQVLSVDQNHVVLKQGNWYNPQDVRADVSNWCAYRIKSNKPRTAPFYQSHKVTANNSTTAVNAVCVEKIAEIELQFIGPDSETIAQSVCMWPLRGDVKAQFQSVNGSVMYDDYTAVSSFFAQEGLNTITAWNVNLRVLWVQTLDTTQNRLREVTLGGTVE